MSEKGRQQLRSSYCDLDYLLVNLGRNKATAMRLVGLFLQNLPNLSERLNDSLDSRDRMALRDALHNIRSSCVLFSGHRCVDLAKDLEDSLRSHAELGGGEEIWHDWKIMADALLNCLQCMADEMSVFVTKNQE